MVGVFDHFPERVGGGPALHATRISPTLFQAARMVMVPCDLMKMKVLQLRDELEARGAPRTGGLKAVLRGRLRALIVAAHAAVKAAASKRQRTAPA